MRASCRRGRGRDRRAARGGASARGLRRRRGGDRRGGLEAAPADLVLLDLRLPDLDGFDVCRRAARALATCRSSSSRRAARRSTASSVSSSAPTTTSSSRSGCASCRAIRAVTRRAARATAPAAPLRVGALEVDVRARRATLDGRELDADAEGVRPARRARRDAGRRDQPPADPRGGLGDELVRPDEDDRRARRVAAQEARRSRLDRDRARRRLPAARAVTRRLLLGYLVTLFVLLGARGPARGPERAHRAPGPDGEGRARRDRRSRRSPRTPSRRRRRRQLDALAAVAYRYAARTGGRVVIVDRARLRPRRHERRAARHRELRVAARDRGGARAAGTPRGSRHS